MTGACLVIARNEESTIEGVLELAQGHQWDVYLVDNGSTDRTAEIGIQFAKEYGNVHYMCKPEPGKGNALRAGMNNVLYWATVNYYNVISTMDGDGEHSATDVYMMSKQVPKRGMVIGNRFKDTPLNQMPLKDLLMYAIVNHYTGATHKDPRCGARSYSVDLLVDLLPKIKARGHGFDLGLYYEALLDNRIIRSYPIGYTKREERVYTSEGELSELLGLEFASEELEDICRVFGRDVGEGKKVIEDCLPLVFNILFME